MYAKMARRKFIGRSRVIFKLHYIILYYNIVCTFYVRAHIIHLQADFKISRQTTGGCKAAYYLSKAACEYVCCQNCTSAAYFVYDFINAFCYLSVLICWKIVGESTIILNLVCFIVLHTVTTSYYLDLFLPICETLLLFERLR